SLLAKTRYDRQVVALAASRLASISPSPFENGFAAGPEGFQVRPTVSFEENFHGIDVLAAISTLNERSGALDGNFGRFQLRCSRGGHDGRGNGAFVGRRGWRNGLRSRGSAN